MLRTFNCGIGMVMLAPEREAARLIAGSRAAGIDCFDIGEVLPLKGDQRVRYLPA